MNPYKAADARIEPKQIQLIHIAKSQLRLSDEVYRHMLEIRYGLDSSKGLLYHQADDLIEYFKGLGFRVKAKRRCMVCAPRPRRDEIPANVVYLASPEQLFKIKILREEVRWKLQDGFMRWLKKYYKIQEIRLSVEASAVIEGLKGLVKTQNRCECRWNGTTPPEKETI